MLRALNIENMGKVRKAGKRGCENIETWFGSRKSRWISSNMNKDDVPRSGTEFLKAFERMQEDRKNVKRYNRDEILQLRDCSLSSKKPTFYGNVPQHTIKELEPSGKINQRRNSKDEISRGEVLSTRNEMKVRKEVFRRVGSGRLSNRIREIDSQDPYRSFRSKSPNDLTSSSSSVDTGLSSTTPEWFTGGPTSKNDTIELGGFEAGAENSEKTTKPRPKMDTITMEEGNNELNSADATKGSPSAFDFEDFLQLELPNLTPGSTGEAPSKSSRFSQFFTSEEQKNIENDFVTFVPKKGGSCKQNDSGKSFMDVFGQVKCDGAFGLKDIPTGKLMNVDDLESEMQNAANLQLLQGQPLHPDVRALMLKKESEQRNFLNLVNNSQFRDYGEQSGGQVTPQVLQKLLLIQQHEETNKRMRQLFLQQMQAAQQSQQRGYYANLLSQQQRARSELMSMMSKDLLYLVLNNRPTYAILSNPQFQAIINSVKRGIISPRFIIQQLQVAVIPFQRELYLAVLHTLLTEPHSPNNPVSAADPLFFQQMLINSRLQQQQQQQQQQQYQQQPTQQQLYAHTANIMQNARMRRELELKSQEENMRKMELARESQNSFGFTPTSVLKSLSEKRAEMKHEEEKEENTSEIEKIVVDLIETTSSPVGSAATGTENNCPFSEETNNIRASTPQEEEEKSNSTLEWKQIYGTSEV